MLGPHAGALSHIHAIAFDDRRNLIERQVAGQREFAGETTFGFVRGGAIGLRRGLTALELISSSDASRGAAIKSYGASQAHKDERGQQVLFEVAGSHDLPPLFTLIIGFGD